MASRRLVPASVREALLGIPSDIASLERNYLHIALLRHPGQGWYDDTAPPAPLVAWLAEQIEVPFPSLARYGSRGATRSNHRRLAVVRSPSKTVATSPAIKGQSICHRQ